MSTADRYLLIDPFEALILMINDKFGFTMRPEVARLVSTTVLEPSGRLQVTIDAKQKDTHRNIARIPTVNTFIYHRLELGPFFGGYITQAEVSGLNPQTTRDIQDFLESNYSVKFFTNDLVHQKIQSFTPNFTLFAHPKSLRWMGGLGFITDLTPRKTEDAIDRKTENDIFRTLEWIPPENIEFG